MAIPYQHVFCVTNDITYDRRIIRHARTLSVHGRTLIIGRQLDGEYSDSDGEMDFKRLKCIFNHGVLFYAEFNFRLFLFLLFQIKITNLICVDLDTVIAGFLVSKFKDIQTFFDANEYFTEVPELLDKPMVKKVWNTIGKIAVPTFDVAYTVNSSLKEALAKKFDRPFHVIKNVPNPTLEKNQSSKHSSFTLVYLGVLNPGRGLSFLVDYVKSTHDISLVIIGDGPLNDSLRVLAGDVSNIIFTGMLGDTAISDHLSRCHVGINLLEITSESYRLSLANKFFDYLNHGLPVITMNLPEYKAVNDQFKCSILLDSLEKKIITSAIEKLQNRDAYLDFQYQATKVCDKYNWETEKKQLLQLHIQQ